MLAANEEIRKAVDTYDDYVAFMADRIPTGARTIKLKYSKTEALEKRGKLLRYDNVNSTHQSLLDGSRLLEWNRYRKYEGVKVISDARFQQLVQLGVEVLPTQ